MNLYLLYDPSTGEIIANLVGSPGCGAQVDERQLEVYDAGPIDDLVSMGITNPNTAYSTDLFYVETGSRSLLKRPAMLLPENPICVKADGTSEIEIFPIPYGAQCVYEDETHTISGNKLTFSAEHVGEYKFSFACFPWLPCTVTVQGVAP